jgi:hypothetical protein
MMRNRALSCGGNVVQNNSYLQTQTILRGLEFALAKGAFDGNAGQKRTAVAVIKEMKGNRSVGGRHQSLTSILKKGATVEGMMKATASSRRTIFRYLNSLEEAGVDIQLEGGRYKLK